MREGLVLEGTGRIWTTLALDLQNPPMAMAAVRASARGAKSKRAVTSKFTA